jgi:hypothetical protein
MFGVTIFQTDYGLGVQAIVPTLPQIMEYLGFEQQRRHPAHKQHQLVGLTKPQTN